MPVVGYLNARSRDDSPHLLEGFRRGLAENGYVQGETVLEAAGRALGLHIQSFWAGTDDEIDAVFKSMKQQGIAALAVTAGPFFDTRRDKIVALAASYAVPTIY